MRLEKTSIIIFSFLIIVLLFTSCKSSTNEDKQPLTVAHSCIRATHAVGLCNLPMFIVNEDKRIEAHNQCLNLINIPNWGDHPAALTSGDVDFSVTPFTNVIAAYANGAPIKIVSGSGITGLYLVASKNIKTPEQLRGKKIGTFRADTLEIFLYCFLKKIGFSYNDVTITYFTDSFELIEAFGNGRIDAMTHVEPYATKAVRQFSANRIAKSQDVWGEGHPDCVLVASDKIIRENPESVKVMILAMMEAENSIEMNLESAIDKVMGKYYKTEKIDVMNAAQSQPPGIDIRNMKDFILERFRDLKDIGYIKNDPDPNIMNFEFLDEVIRKNPDLYKKLKVRSE